MKIIEGGIIMEYTDDNVLGLEIRKNNKRRVNQKFIQKIYKHKLMATIVLTFIILSTINIIMIYNFFTILQNI